ncbi:MAG: hypothetical protein C4316_03620 [Chloroflexota bacterium]
MGGRLPFRLALLRLVLIVLTAFWTAGATVFALIFLWRGSTYLQLLLVAVSPVPITPIVSRLPDGPGWTGTDRVNILLLGVDSRPDESVELARTDTIILATIDPVNRRAAMLNIPRDLWVPIPVGPGNTVVQDRINTAHRYGTYYKYPGGGPALAKKTVEYNFGVKVDYYVRVDFKGFTGLVDALGGVVLDNPYPLRDDEYPTENYGVQRIFFFGGLQPMDGQAALKFVRSRHQDTDFGRIRRQQLVLLAMRQRALELNLLPRLPQLIAEYGNLVSTDLKPLEVVALARVAAGIDQGSVTVRAIEGPAVRDFTGEDGAYLLLPVKPEISRIIRGLFEAPAPREVPEESRVEVLNGTRIPGLARRTADYLQAQGFQKVTFGNAAVSVDQEHTVIYDLTGKPETVKRLQQLLRLPAGSVQALPADGGLAGRNGEQPADVRIVIGRDLTLPSE